MRSEQPARHARHNGCRGRLHRLAIGRHRQLRLHVSHVTSRHILVTVSLPDLLTQTNNLSFRQYRQFRTNDPPLHLSVCTPVNDLAFHLSHVTTLTSDMFFQTVLLLMTCPFTFPTVPLLMTCPLTLQTVPLPMTYPFTL